MHLQWLIIFCKEVSPAAYSIRLEELLNDNFQPTLVLYLVSKQLQFFGREEGRNSLFDHRHIKPFSRPQIQIWE